MKWCAARLTMTLILSPEARLFTLIDPLRGAYNMKTATVNHANEAIYIALKAMNYTPRIGAINYAVKTVEQLHGVRFNKLLTQYINRGIA